MWKLTLPPTAAAGLTPRNCWPGSSVALNGVPTTCAVLVKFRNSPDDGNVSAALGLIVTVDPFTASVVVPAPDKIPCSEET